MTRLDWQHTQTPPDYAAIFAGITAPIAVCTRSSYPLREFLKERGGVVTETLFVRGELQKGAAQTLLDQGFVLAVEPYEADTFFINDLGSLKAMGGDRIKTVGAPIGPVSPQKRQQLLGFFTEAGISPFLEGDRPVLANSLLIRLPGVRARQLVNALKIDGVAITNGEGCSLGLGVPSFVLQNYGFNDTEAREAISLSWDPALSETDLLGAAKKLLFRYRQVKQLS